METNFSKQFEELFKIPFNTVIDIKEMGVETYDYDHLIHYINMATKDVYTYNTFQKEWLEKNEYQNDAWQMLRFYYFRC